MHSAKAVFCTALFRQLLATGRWFPPGTPVAFNRKLISSSPFHRLIDMTLAVAQALNPNKPNQTVLVSALHCTAMFMHCASELYSNLLVGLMFRVMGYLILVTVLSHNLLDTLNKTNVYRLFIIINV